ncbi:MAG TPA: hypothetical protein VFP40_10720, partial [Terriglobales bacterium]|nr:hypothetical protein [Terriglobales bacterium]
MIDARRGWSLFALLLFACNLSLGQTKTNEGDVWLAKSPEARSSLLLGLTIGMSKGFGDGCATYYKNAPTQKPHTLKDDLFAKCIKHAPGFSNAMSYYEDRVTDFYTRFPNNR